METNKNSKVKTIRIRNLVELLSSAKPMPKEEITQMREETTSRITHYLDKLYKWRRKSMYYLI